MNYDEIIKKIENNKKFTTEDFFKLIREMSQEEIKEFCIKLLNSKDSKINLTTITNELKKISENWNDISNKLTFKNEEQIYSDIICDFLSRFNFNNRGFKIVKDEFRKHPNADIQLPQRGSSKSAGYDICTPIDITISPNGITDAIQTDLKVYMQDDEVLLIVPRSSLGFKKGLMLINTIGVIDSDYYENPDNDGNIGFKLKNLTDKEVTIKAGERIMQGIFVKYGIVDNDSCTTERIGGIGSTN